MNLTRPTVAKIYKIRIKTAFLKDPETIVNKMPFLEKINQHFLSFLEMKQKKQSIGIMGTGIGYPNEARARMKGRYGTGGRSVSSDVTD